MLKEGAKRKVKEKKLLQFFGAEVVLQLSEPGVPGQNSEVTVHSIILIGIKDFLSIEGNRGDIDSDIGHMYRFSTVICSLMMPTVTKKICQTFVSIPIFMALFKVNLKQKVIGNGLWKEKRSK